LAEQRRILITGVSSYWGGRLAEALESFEQVEAIIGVDEREPTRELERTEYVKVSNHHSLLSRIVRAAEIDTVVDTRLVVNSFAASPREAHENNVIDTMNILTACDGPESPVKRFVFKSSAHWYGCEQDDPAFFVEGMERKHPARTAIERDIVEAERAVRDYAVRRPEALVTTLRCANVLGRDVVTAYERILSLPAVPMVLGFDPRTQFVHADDVVHALEHAVISDVPGVFNVAGDGVLALSEVASLAGKLPLPILPPFGAGLAALPLRRLGLRVPDEMWNLLRFGRGLDNRAFKASGFDYSYTSREAVQRFAEHMRLRKVMRDSEEGFHYDREVEEFLRWSPNVRREPSGEPTSETGSPSA
jgi:UDP-glucose 4-epimerase